MNAEERITLMIPASYFAMLVIERSAAAGPGPGSASGG